MQFAIQCFRLKEIPELFVKWMKFHSGVNMYAAINSEITNSSWFCTFFSATIIGINFGEFINTELEESTQHYISFYYVIAIGALGYFPSYTLGAMMAAQLFETAKVEIPGLEAKIEKVLKMSA